MKLEIFKISKNIYVFCILNSFGHAIYSGNASNKREAIEEANKALHFFK